MKDRPRAFAVLVAIFLFGIIIGIAGSYAWLKSSDDSISRLGSPRPYPDGPGFNGQQPPNGQQAGGMTRAKPPDFKLTPEQDKQLREIAKETSKGWSEFQKERKTEWEKSDSLWNQKAKDFWDENSRKVRSVLNEEQKVQFDDWLKNRGDWWQRSPRKIGPETPRDNRRKPEIPKENRKRLPDQL